MPTWSKIEIHRGVRGYLSVLLRTGWNDLPPNASLAARRTENRKYASALEVVATALRKKLGCRRKIGVVHNAVGGYLHMSVTIAELCSCDAVPPAALHRARQVCQYIARRLPRRLFMTPKMSELLEPPSTVHEVSP